jgi:hypothetical protein
MSQLQSSSKRVAVRPLKMLNYASIRKNNSLAYSVYIITILYNISFCLMLENYGITRVTKAITILFYFRKKIHLEKISSAITILLRMF